MTNDWLNADSVIGWDYATKSLVFICSDMDTFIERIYHRGTFKSKTWFKVYYHQLYPQLQSQIMGPIFVSHPSTEKEIDDM